MVTLTARPKSLDLDLQKTAIIVVDMQNAFASKGGMLDLAGLDISAADAVIEVNRRLLAAARKSGVPVVYLQTTYKPDLSNGGDETSPNYHKEIGMVMSRERPELAGSILVDGSWDGQLVDALAPQPGDHIVHKTRYSGFCRTNLENLLHELGIRYLLFTGIATNVCVESTARDAYFAEFWPILIEDAMNHAGPDFVRQATLWNFENIFGWITCSDELIKIFRQTTACR
jgi:ureidoacrylate peracid hydrolase